MTARPVILVLGPTAGGKTALSIELARRLPGGGECICADSMQVYRGMDIGTAKPDAEERAAVPHHLLDVADPSEDGFTVDTWLELAEAAVAAVRSRGRWPIVVGGTNLYVQAFLAGLMEGPAPDPDLRAALDRLDARALHARLAEVDRAAAERIHANDRRRAIRAIEVHAATGRPLSELQREWTGGQRRTDVFIVGLEHAVEAINRRINRRVRAMIERGLVDEVVRLRSGRGLGRQAREALGYSQILDHLEGRSTLEEAVEQIGIRSRRFAKQQRTWLRRFRTCRPAVWLAAGDRSAQDLAGEALTSILAAEPPGPSASARA